MKTLLWSAQFVEGRGPKADKSAAVGFKRCDIERNPDRDRRSKRFLVTVDVRPRRARR
jgi:hypothetical protein